MQAPEYSEDLHILFEDFFENSLIGLHIVGADGKIIRANKAELKLLGYENTPDEYIGQTINEFHSDQTVIDDMLTRLVADSPLINYQATVKAKDNSLHTMTIYSNSRMSEGSFINTRCFSKPDDDSIAAVSLYLKHNPTDIDLLLADLSETEKHENFTLLHDFFENSEVCLHIVGPDGNIIWANRKELQSMGYDSDTNAYVGKNISDFHASNKTINSMLSNLLSDTPLINQHAEVCARNGAHQQLSIYSNSRFRDGQFLNTRCISYPLTAPVNPGAEHSSFSWPPA